MKNEFMISASDPSSLEDLRVALAHVGIVSEFKTIALDYARSETRLAFFVDDDNFDRIVDFFYRSIKLNNHVMFRLYCHDNTQKMRNLPYHEAEFKEAMKTIVARLSRR